MCKYSSRLPHVMLNGTFTSTHKSCGDFTKYLVNDENFTDVTLLSCDDKQIKAHQVILDQLHLSRELSCPHQWWQLVHCSWKVTWGGGTHGPTKQSLSGTNWIGRKDSYRGENSGIRRWPFSCKRNKNWKTNQTIQGGPIR